MDLEYLPCKGDVVEALCINTVYKLYCTFFFPLYHTGSLLMLLVLRMGGENVSSPLFKNKDEILEIIYLIAFCSFR